MHYLLKNGHILLRKVLLNLNFQDESHLYANSLIYILSFCLKCLIFQFFSRGIPKHISILTGVQKRRISCQKTGHLLLKNLPLMLKLHDEGHLYSNLLFYILTIYRKCLLFQFLGAGIHMPIPILTDVQNGRIICEEIIVF